MLSKPPDSWDQDVDRLDADAFVERYSHPFLLISVEAGDDPQTFRTRAMIEGGESLGEVDPLAFEVVPLVKGAANPYEGRIIIGRARNCDVVLRHVSVSKFHADFRVIAPEEAELTDRGSRNGTWLGNTRLDAASPQIVRSGDRLAFGSVTVQFLSPRALHASRR